MARIKGQGLQKRFNRWQTRGIRSIYGHDVPFLETGEYQLNFLKQHGLLPHHKLLEVGCAVLRGGLHFIKYLDIGNYFGFDKEPELIQLAIGHMLVTHDLLHKQATIEVIDNFDMTPFQSMQFDYVFAQSIFSHLTPELVDLCLRNIIPLMTHDGCFYSTFHEGPEVMVGEKHSVRLVGDERARVEYPFGFFQECASKVGLKVSLLGNWEHENWKKGYPDNEQGQKMLLFQK